MYARCQPGEGGSLGGMQVLQDNVFCHSGSRFGAERGFEDERQLLTEEQKLCKVRARRFSLETNRRRKALEERQKQWDVQEQRLRETILHQRRQQVQDATERFQRAHLPPSQRRRQSLRRNVPSIEDALNQLQGTLSSYTQQSSFLSSNSNIIRSCTPSPKPPTLSKSSHRQAPSAVEAYTKLLREQGTTCFKTSQDTEKKQEKQQDHSPQDRHLSDCWNSESLSSKDSLKNEDPDHSTKNLQCSYSSSLLDSDNPRLNLRKQNDLFPTSDLTLSAGLLLGDNLTRSQKLHEPKEREQEDSEGPNNKMQISKASWRFTSEQMRKRETQPALQGCNLLTYCEVISADPEHFEVNSPQNSPNDNIIVTNRVTPDTTALEPSCAKQEALLDLRQQRDHDDRQLKHPSATEIILPAKNGNSKDILSGAPPKPNIFLNDSTADNTSQEGTLQQTGKENHCLSSQKEPSASLNNLNKVSNSEPIIEKPINTALLQHACLSNIQSDTLKCLKCSEEEEEVQTLPVSVGTTRSVCEVRFIKGILKKQSKYMSRDATCLYGSGHLIFAKQVALAIRDSVELTRAKTKDVENNNRVKKKLRWFDEVHVEKEDKEQSIMKQMKGKSSNLSQSKKNPEDHQLSLTTVSGASKVGPGMTPPASTGYHFTKQAWADVGVQVSLSHERADEVKVPRSSTRTGGPKVPRRESSARVGGGPVSSRTRKGTLIRPQSATEVSQIAKTKGKIMMPRIDQALCKDNSEDFFSPYKRHLIRTDSNVMYTPMPPSYTCSVSEGNTKGTLSTDHQETQGCSRRRGMVFNEKALCLDCTPTDEEISRLWHGVRSALAPKDAKTMLRRQVLESGRAVRKPCVEQSRQSPGSGYRSLPQPSQSTHPVKMFSSTYDVAFTDEGLKRAAQLHLAEVHTEGLLEERNIVAAMETAQTQSPGTVQQRSQQHAPTRISLEEQKILLSLDRLNHQLHCVREHAGSDTGTRSLLLVDAPSTKEMKVTNHHKHRARASSANNHSQYLKKF
ncbi:centrosomal protein of 126 kDa [Xiphias gladius]|uniref:centrosomal protein of 126 kDa n=1 Tax=Xiphias gladius TaxID=8245 RepID=UPI001A97F962|nr:centrosomal protein of 126 kDa [Xiphias gladius]